MARADTTTTTTTTTATTTATITTTATTTAVASTEEGLAALGDGPKFDSKVVESRKAAAVAWLKAFTFQHEATVGADAAAKDKIRTSGYNYPQVPGRGRPEGSAPPSPRKSGSSHVSRYESQNFYPRPSTHTSSLAYSTTNIAHAWVL